MLDVIKQELLDWIRNGNMDEMFNDAERHLNKSSDAYKAFLLLRARYQELKTHNNRGLIKFEDYNLEKNKLNSAAYDLIEALTRNDLKKAPVHFDFEALEAQRKPDPKSLELNTAFNAHNIVVGGCIEIAGHPNLQSNLPIEQYGWDPFKPGDITISNLNQRFPVSALERLFTLDETLRPPNNKKFCLSNLEGGLIDEPPIKLEVMHSDFFTVKSIVNQYHADFPLDFLTTYGGLNPQQSRIPHSLCLHHIVLLDDGYVLCQLRGKNLSYHQSKFSFSQEEQLSEDNIRAQMPTVAHLMIRGLCEEIFPLSGNEATIRKNWDEHLKDLVDAMRIWSVFVETNIFNFGLMGFFKLNISLPEYVLLFKHLMNIGNIDKEATFYATSISELEKLLKENQCHVEGVFSREKILVTEADLHPTSRYRIYKLLQQLGKNR